ncbi:Kelch repeat-containing protein [Herpetosiphon geysericola]|uniref:Uncharacterized protein n=1 Tax=Herpetosiphon geysericola TaxID=70996 RepID=A0A0P6Y0K1_9CHLR|nr:hypothetical protein [Herpetosiphon geysericola]KPL85429.1 hypothetical protein SE18_17485 [Herpetosiphon geysericola]
MGSFLITATLFITLVSSVAAISLNATISVSSGDFASGYFGLTGLTQQDQVIDGVTYGGVQLIPQGALSQWQDASNQLCRRLADMGTASYKNFLYTIGGSGASSGNVAPTNEVCSAQVINAGGETSEWTLSPRTLPHPLTRLSSVAVNHPTIANKGIIYTFGGQKITSGDQQYSNTIYSSVINADGSLEPWQTQALTTGEDLIYSSVTAYTTPNNQTYIYLVGGRSKDSTDNFAPEFVRRSVRRTLVGANGVLGPWQAMPDLPITPDMFTSTNGCDSKVGLHSMDVTNFDAVTIESGQSTYRAFLAVGGTFELGNGDRANECTSTIEASAQVMLGKLDSNGMLSWQTQKYVLPEPLSGPRVIGVNQKIYVVGGKQGAFGEPTNRIYSSFINIDSFSLPLFGQSNFRVSDNALTAQQARSAHGLEMVYINNRPVAYMFGGIRVGNTYQDDVLFGFVGTDDDIDLTVGGYPSPGLYVSPPIQLRAPGFIEQVLWDATLPNAPISTDIQIEYRMAETRAALDSVLNWETVDGDTSSDKYSIQGPNTGIGNPSIQGRWFQYRAQLTTQNASEPGATPILRNLRIRYKVDGHPSLFIDNATMSTVTPAGITAFSTTIKNGIKPGSNDTENVLDADIESQGTFFVDMYILPPGSADVPPSRNGDGVYPYGVAFAEVNRLNLPQDGSFTLDGFNDNTLWRRSCTLAPVDCPVVIWQALFNQTGIWKVYLVVDSGNNVNEADTPSGQREQDNLYSFTVTSTVAGSTIRLPVVGINFLNTPTNP